MNGIIIFFGIIAVMVFAVWHIVGYELRKADKEEKLKQLQLELKLLEEKKKPKWVVVFELPSGAIEQTKPIEPEVVTIGRRTRYQKIYTSKQVASQKLTLFFDMGYFMDKDNMTYPVCNVMKAYIKEE